MKLYSMVIHKLFCVSLHCRLHSLDTQGQVVCKIDNAIHRINLYPVDTIILVSFLILIRWGSDLSGGYRYPRFEQSRPGLCCDKCFMHILVRHEMLIDGATQARKPVNVPQSTAEVRHCYDYM